MARSCVTCTSEQQLAIEDLLRRGTSDAKVARLFGQTESSVARHRKRHMDSDGQSNQSNAQKLARLSFAHAHVQSGAPERPRVAPESESIADRYSARPDALEGHLEPGFIELAPAAELPTGVDVDLPPGWMVSTWRSVPITERPGFEPASY